MKRWVISFIVIIFSLLLGISFLLGLPHLVKQAKHANQQNRESTCRALDPSFVHPRFSSFPQEAPDFSLKNEKGEEISLSTYRGQVILLTFWATWCETCMIEMPSLEKLNQRMQGKPFHMMAVSNDRSWEDIHRFFPKGTSLPILLDSPSLGIAHLYGTAKLPETYIIDKQGNIRYYIVSERQIWQFDQVVDCLKALIEE